MRWRKDLPRLHVTWSTRTSRPRSRGAIRIALMCMARPGVSSARSSPAGRTVDRSPRATEGCRPRSRDAGGGLRQRVQAGESSSASGRDRPRGLRLRRGLLVAGVASRCTAGRRSVATGSAASISRCVVLGKRPIRPFVSSSGASGATRKHWTRSHWGCFKLAHAVDSLPGVSEGFLVYAARSSAWKKPARFAEWLDGAVISPRQVLVDHPSVWKWLLGDSSKARPLAPETIKTTRVASCEFLHGGVPWEIRVAAVVPGDEQWFALGEGWPVP